MKAKLLLAVLAAFLTTSFAAVAAEETAKDNTAPAEKAVKPAKAKKKVKPHNHMQEKNGPVSAEPSTAEGEPQKPLHEHGKFHKQQ
jgi:hypothetical protein